MMDSSTHCVSAGTQEGERVFSSSWSHSSLLLSLSYILVTITFSPCFFLHLLSDNLLVFSLSLTCFNPYFLSFFLFINCYSYIFFYMCLCVFVRALAYSQFSWMKRHDWSRHYPVISQLPYKDCLWAESRRTWRVACRDLACLSRAASGTF